MGRGSLVIWLEFRRVRVFLYFWVSFLIILSWFMWFECE